MGFSEGTVQTSQMFTLDPGPVMHSLIPEEDATGGHTEGYSLSLHQTSNLQTLILHYCSADPGMGTVLIIPALIHTQGRGA